MRDLGHGFHSCSSTEMAQRDYHVFNVDNDVNWSAFVNTIGIGCDHSLFLTRECAFKGGAAVCD